MTREKIIDFLRNNHNNFANLTEQNFNAWLEAWEDSALSGYPHIEISRHDSNSGATVVLDQEIQK